LIGCPDSYREVNWLIELVDSKKNKTHYKTSLIEHGLLVEFGKYPVIELTTPNRARLLFTATMKPFVKNDAGFVSTFPDIYRELSTSLRFKLFSTLK